MDASLAVRRTAAGRVTDVRGHAASKRGGARLSGKGRRTTVSFRHAGQRRVSVPVSSRSDERPVLRRVDGLVLWSGVRRARSVEGVEQRAGSLPTLMGIASGHQTDHGAVLGNRSFVDEGNRIGSLRRGMSNTISRRFKVTPKKNLMAPTYTSWVAQLKRRYSIR